MLQRVSRIFPPPTIKFSSRHTANVFRGISMSSCCSERLVTCSWSDGNRLIMSFKTTWRHLRDESLDSLSWACTRWFSMSEKSSIPTPHEQWALPRCRIITSSRSINSFCNKANLVAISQTIHIVNVSKKTGIYHRKAQTRLVQFDSKRGTTGATLKKKDCSSTVTKTRLI